MPFFLFAFAYALITPILGVVKADIGIRNGVIVGIGKSGNPSIMDNVTENMVVSNSTEVTAGEGLIATAGFFDTHVHLPKEQRREIAISVLVISSHRCVY